MRVACCFTKTNENAIKAIENFSKGVKESGDEPILIHNLSEISRLKNCDTSVQICAYNSLTDFQNKDNTLRFHIKRWATLYEKPYLILDTGFLLNKRYNDNEIEGRYYQVGLNDIKRDGLIQKEFPSDRWNLIKSKLEFECAGYFVNFNDTAPIIVFGQFENGTSVQNDRILEWMKNVIDLIHGTYTNEILLLPHPNQLSTPKNHDKYKIKVCHDEPSLVDTVSSCYFCVAYTTNAAVYPVLLGKPLVCYSPKCVAWDMSSQSVEELFHYGGKKDEWFNMLGYNQWNLEEFKNGDCWNFIKDYL